MDESQLRTIEQIAQFLNASAEVAFTAHGDPLPCFKLTASSPPLVLAVRSCFYARQLFDR